jgi:hypothetical protein
MSTSAIVPQAFNNRPNRIGRLLVGLVVWALALLYAVGYLVIMEAYGKYYIEWHLWWDSSIGDGSLPRDVWGSRFMVSAVEPAIASCFAFLVLSLAGAACVPRGKVVRQTTIAMTTFVFAYWLTLAIRLILGLA